jgi:hypothetical protein
MVTEMRNIIEDIENLPYYREYECRKCRHMQKAYILDIWGKCENCGNVSKLRGFASIGSEAEDIVDTVLQWMGNGKELEQALNRKREIDSSINNEKGKK